MKRKIIRYLFTFGFAGVTGCVTNINNSAPVLTNTLTDISIEMNDSLRLDLQLVEAYDDNGDELQLIFDDGDNYVLSGDTLIPEKGFVGDLFIGVVVYDGTSFSNKDTIIVSVVTTLQLLPLLEGAWWTYTDSIPANDTTLKSRLEVGNLITSSVSGTDSAYELCWSHLEEDACYIISSTTSGVTLQGGICTNDTLVSPQNLFKYPASSGESWKYHPLKYNVTDKIFFLQDDEQEIAVTNTSVYVTVPAGLFHCIEYTETATSTTNPDEQVEEKIYYSPGVGYIKMVTTVNDKVVWKKELIDYYVEQQHK